jgi:hypothetical protein
MDIPRAGGIIDYKSCDFINLLPFFSWLNMPLYIHWGSCFERPLYFPDFLSSKNLSPHSSEVTKLYAMLEDTRRSQAAGGCRNVPVLLSTCFKSPYCSSESGPTGRPDSQATADDIAPAAAKDGAAPPAAKDDITAPRIFPQVEPYSGQYPQEDWQSFFSR